MTGVALMQPLPSLVFEAANGASEFASLGLSILARLLSEGDGHDVTLHHPSTAAEVAAAVEEADVVVIGDFRYYAYFCNPLPLIERAVAILREAGFDGAVVAGGRHSRYFPTPPEGVTVASSCADLLAELGGDPRLRTMLGSDTLPAPALADTELLLTPELPGSRSRPTDSVPGQLLITAGCRYRCAFCEKAGTFGGQLDDVSLRRQLNEFAAAGASYVIVWDEVFVRDDPSFGQVLDLLRETGLGFGCNTRFDGLDDRRVEALAEAGCRSVLLGVEAAPGEARQHRALRTDAGKRPSTAAYEQMTRRLHGCGMAAVASVIIGLADDDPMAIRDRISRCYALGFDHVYARPLVPFPESRLYRQAAAGNQIAPYGAWDATVYDTFPFGYPVMSPLPRDELCRLIQPRR